MTWYKSYNHLCEDVRLRLYAEGQLMETLVSMLYLFGGDERCVTLEEGHLHL